MRRRMRAATPSNSSFSRSTACSRRRSWRKSPKHRARAEWELPLSHLAPLAEHCSARKIQFSCTPFYLEAVAELAPFVDFYKVASYELLVTRSAEGLRPHRQAGGAVHRHGHAWRKSGRVATACSDAGAHDITLLHCVSAYPTPVAEANLSAIDTIRAATGLPTGWSDHTRRPAVIERAVHRWGARAVEFHLDLDGKGAEYAAGHCWLPEEIAPVIARIRESLVGRRHRIQGSAAVRTFRPRMARRSRRRHAAAEACEARLQR